MKKLVSIILLAFLFGCSSKSYVYKFNMTHPVQSEKTQYENDSMSISIDIRSDGIGFEVYNKLNEGIKIEWDEISFALDGNTYRVIYNDLQNDKYSNISRKQPPSTIPPKAFLKGKIIPVKNIITYTSRGQSFALLKEMFPKSDFGNKKVRKEIASRLGQKITIYFPYYLNN